MIKGWDIQQLKDFCADRGMKWRFTTPAAPHQNGCSESILICLFISPDRTVNDVKI